MSVGCVRLCLPAQHHGVACTVPREVSATGTLGIIPSGKRFQDCAQDFAVFRRMSPRMRTVLKARGVDDFKTVKKFIDGMKQTTGLSEYCLNDFIIYSCLLDETIFVRMFPV